MSEIQSVIFNKKYYDTESARYWLNKHNIKRMKKVRITKNFYRYRNTDTRKYKKITIKPIHNSKIELVIGYF